MNKVSQSEVSTAKLFHNMDLLNMGNYPTIERFMCLVHGIDWDKQSYYITLAEMLEATMYVVTNNIDGVNHHTWYDK